MKDILKKALQNAIAQRPEPKPPKPGSDPDVRPGRGQPECCCFPGASPANDDTGQNYCNDRKCFKCVCKIDPFCCSQVWDSACAAIARGRCGGSGYVDRDGNFVPGTNDCPCRDGMEGKGPCVKEKNVNDRGIQS